MDLFIAILFIAVLMLSLGAVFGAPYLPTLKKEGEAALDLLNLEKGQTILDLGSGDGTFLLQAAQKGFRGIGWEISPILVIFSKLRLWRYRKTTRIYWRNMWQTKLPKVDAIYIFGIGRYMAKFERKLKAELSRPTKVITFAFKLPNTKPHKTKKGVYMYELP